MLEKNEVLVVNDVNVFAMVTRDFSEIHDHIDERLKKNKGYTRADEKFRKFCSENRQFRIEVESIVTAIETECKEEGYNQGFAEAVRLFASCMK